MKRHMIGLIALGLFATACSSDGGGDSAPSPSPASSSLTGVTMVTSPPSSTTVAPPVSTYTETVTVEVPDGQATETVTVEDPADIEAPFGPVEIDGYPVVVGGPCGNNPGMSYNDIVCTDGIWTQ